MTILNYKLLPYNFDEFQIEAIKSQHKNTLINAGAGSGKTSTILGRILYLLSEKNADPEKMLVLVFNKNVANEIREKLYEISQLVEKNKELKRKFPKLVEKLISVSESKAKIKRVHTYHSYALKLTKETDKNILARTPSIAYRNIDELIEIFAELFEDIDVVKKTNNYFLLDHKISTSTKISKNPYFFRNIHEDIRNYSEYVKYIKPFGQTIRGEQVKSNEELNIANFLHNWGVKYIYEDTIKDDELYFKPDFHLIKHDENNKIIYDTYYEHFGLDKNGNPPHYFKDEEKENYLYGYKKKKEYFEKNNFDYFFTYSYQFSDETIYDVIKRELNKRQINPNSADRLASTQITINHPYAYHLKENLLSALSNFKLNELSIEQLIENNKEINNTALQENQDKNFLSKLISVFFDKLDSIFYKDDNLANYRSTLAFIEIFSEFHRLYEDKLQKTGIDFDDQIIMGKEAKSSIVNNSIDYCISDEFQDISIPRAEIITNLQLKNPKLSLFFVGDDWQSINGFAGSNYRIMTKYFSKFFGDYKQVDLKYTYRFNDNVCAITKNFIEKNNDQIKKDLISHRGANPKNNNDRSWNSKVPLIINFIPNEKNLEPGMKIYHSIYKSGVITNQFLNEYEERIINIRFKNRSLPLNLDDTDHKEINKIIWDKTFKNEIYENIKAVIDRIKNSKKTILFINRLKIENYLDDNYTRELILKIKNHIGCKGSFSNEKLTGGLFKEISFMTAHSSKGLEADYVIILKGYGSQGFPNPRETHKVLYPFLTHQIDREDFTQSKKIIEDLKKEEERRLFYVALTRSKNSTYIYTDNENRFIKEIINNPDNEEKIKINHVISKKNEQKKRQTDKSSYQEKMKQIKTKHKNAYKPWTNAEELELLNLFMKKISISEIANKLNRQQGGIKARLKKLNVID